MGAILKKSFVLLLKFGIPLAIIAWLLTTVDRDQFERLWHRDKHWTTLAAGFVLVLIAVCLTFVRWYLLVRALDIPFRLADAFRLGSLGYLFNFIAVSSVGGDLFKALFVAHEQPGRRTEAVATVAIDRVIGLLALLVVASVAILASGVSEADAVVRAICQFTLIVTGAGMLAVAVILVPRFGHSRLARRLARIPKVGPVFDRLVQAVEIYRGQLGMLAAAAGVGVGIHVLLSLAIYLLAAALFDNPPTLGEHLIIVPLSMVAGGVPLTPGGLGTFEGAMQKLYELLPLVPRDYGILVALAYRLITILVAAVGVVYYWSARRQVMEVLEEAEAST